MIGQGHDSKKLTLRRETLQILEIGDLMVVQGALAPGDIHPNLVAPQSTACPPFSRTNCDKY
jgi:hypothetical protein